MTVTAQEILQASQIPSMPETLQKVLAAANDPAATGESMEKHVMRDPALSLKVLKLVNSSYYALGRRVTSIRQAVVMVGFPGLRSIASGMVMLEAFGRIEGLEKNYLNLAWRHSLIASRFVPFLYRGQRGKGPDDVGLAAMVHDVGHLLLTRHFDAEYPKLVADCSFPLPETENERFGIDHAHLGAELLKEWAFPPDVIELVRHHHNPAGFSGDVQSAHALRAADLLAEAYTYSSAVTTRPETEIPPELVQSLSVIGWKWSDLGERADALRTIVDSVPMEPESE